MKEKNEHAVELGRLGGKSKSEKKVKASRLNGLKGGRKKEKPYENKTDGSHS